MRRPPPTSTRPCTLFPYPSLFRSGCGSVAIEWLLAHGSTHAIAFEVDPDRAARTRANALHLGVDRLTVMEGRAPDILTGRTRPEAVFIGGGLSQSLLAALFALRSEEHTSELQSLMRISYAVFCLKKKTIRDKKTMDNRS